ncbi:MAG: MATE family efflux transporter [Anaerostipes sp.]|nr:MATE family efflux transporter [Anaerostipes sp.]
MNQIFMKEKPILPLVLSMSLPMVISMLVNSLYNIIDSFFVAKISEDAMTALSLVYPLQNLVMAIGVGFGIGINTTVAFFLGAKKKEYANNAATQGIILNTIHGIILTIRCILIIPYFLKIFTNNINVIDYGLRYSNIVFLFSVIITVGVTFEKVFQSVGKMVVSMISMMSGCIVNIILDPVLIFGLGAAPKMGMEGAAIATGIGQVVTLLIYIIFYVTKPMPIHFEFRKQLTEEKLFQRLYAVGIPATLNMALPSLLITVLNGILAAYSQIYVLTLGIYYKLQTFIYLTTNGIVQGIRPLVGYNYGAGEHKRVLNIHKTALCLAMIVMAMGMCICLFAPKSLMQLFATNEKTIAAGVTALRIISMGFIVSAISVVATGTLEGLGKGTLSLVISLMRYVIIIIPIAFVLSKWIGATGVWHAFWITEVLTAIISYVIIKKPQNHTVL